MKIIAIRHGETPTNAAERITGWNDEDLTALGVQQAREMAAALTSEFALIAASTLLRARHTAAILAERHPAEIVFDPDLRERDFGSLNGKTWAEIEAETGLPLRQRDIEQLQYDYRPWGGECVADVRARVERFLQRAPGLAAGQDLAVVTHGGVIKMFYVLLNPNERRRIPNCSVHEFNL